MFGWWHSISRSQHWWREISSKRVKCIPIYLVQAGLPSSKIITIFLKDEPTHMKQEICGRHAVKDMSSYYCHNVNRRITSLTHSCWKRNREMFQKYEILKCFNLGCSAVDSKKQTNKFSQKTKHEEHTVLVFYTFYTF